MKDVLVLLSAIVHPPDIVARDRTNYRTRRNVGPCIAQADDLDARRCSSDAQVQLATFPRNSFTTVLTCSFIALNYLNTNLYANVNKASAMV